MENKKKSITSAWMKGLVSAGMLRVGAATGTESSWERDPELSDT